MKKKNLVTSSIIGLLSSALAFLGVVSVCGFPLLAAFLAWFGIGASHLEALSEYQSLFTGVAVLALCYGFYTVYFKQRQGCASAGCQDEGASPESSCSPSSGRSRGLAKLMLWVAAIAILATFFVGQEADPSSESCRPTCGALSSDLEFEKEQAEDLRSAACQP